MKKLFLTAVVALFTLGSSAQFMVVTTYDGDQEENIDKITANLGIGYSVSDVFTIGMVRNAEEEFDIWARYDLGQFMDGAYLSAQMPTEDMADNMKIGVGMSFSVWNSMYIEPNYSMPLKEDDAGNREGSFKIGLAYRF